MSEKSMGQKKGKNFREYIEQDKKKGQTAKKVMHTLTSLNASVLYGGSFLTVFLGLAAVFYILLSPSVFVWAGILVGAALASSLLASRITNMLRKSQWKYRAV